MSRLHPLLASVILWAVTLCLPLDSLAAAGKASAMTAPQATAASAFPVRPITIIVTFPPGGGTDLLARKLGVRLERSLGVPVVVENRPGASGNIGARAVAAAVPDGYTLLMVNSSFAINPGVYPELGFSPVNDFDAVFNIAWIPSLLVAHPESGIDDIRGLQAYARENWLPVASCGNGTPQHLAIQMLAEAGKAPLQHVPYKGCGPALNDVLAGTVPLGIVTLASARPFLDAGRLRGLGVTSLDRSPLLPRIPSMAESGLENYVMNQWHGLLAPAGTPPERLNTLAHALETLLQSDDVKQELHALGYVVGDQTRAQFQAQIEADIHRFADLTARMGLRAD